VKLKAIVKGTGIVSDPDIKRKADGGIISGHKLFTEFAAGNCGQTPVFFPKNNFHKNSLLLSINI